jgi:hypothetical protein
MGHCGKGRQENAGDGTAHGEDTVKAGNREQGLRD